MTVKAFVYTELQISVPFNDAPWRDVSDAIRGQPGSSARLGSPAWAIIRFVDFTRSTASTARRNLSPATSPVRPEKFWRRPQHTRI